MSCPAPLSCRRQVNRSGGSERPPLPFFFDIRRGRERVWWRSSNSGSSWPITAWPRKQPTDQANPNIFPSARSLSLVQRKGRLRDWKIFDSPVSLLDHSIRPVNASNKKKKSQLTMAGLLLSARLLFAQSEWGRVGSRK